MLGKASEKLSNSGDNAALQNVSFVQGYSNQLQLKSGSVDIITCSQSFHWMEPFSTLEEIARCLIPGGVFAAYDCDWPIPLQQDIEFRYNCLIAKAEDVLSQLVPEDEQPHKWDKAGHLARIQASGWFSFSREIVFHSKDRKSVV